MVKTPIEKDQFVKKNLGLVHSCANRFRARGIEYDDLFSSGCVGLLKAIEGFDDQRGIMFSTYAVPVILGEIKRLFRDGGALKVSRSLKEISMKAVRERERFSVCNGREPTVNELAEALETDVETVVEALNASIPPMSMTINDEDGNTQLDICVEGDDEALCDIISLKEVVSRLEERDRSLIALRYFKSKTQSQTASILGMTQVQVSRREKKLLEKLRVKLSC